MLLAERYRTTEILGHGGMGEVYRGCDELLGRPVAVKLLRPDLIDRTAAARFRHEARAAALVKHPHVVAIYDFGHSNGEYFLVMELLEGHSVAHELALHGPVDPERALGIVGQVASGLAAAHRLGVVHRDIKPDNLLLDADGSVKIADFGVARSPTDPPTRPSGPILGTSQYLAPERAVGQPATAASDVYALGCVLYQLLTGHPPFDDADPTAVLHQHVRATPAIPDELPVFVATLLRRMLAKDPAARPTSTEVAHQTSTTAFGKEFATEFCTESTRESNPQESKPQHAPQLAPQLESPFAPGSAPGPDTNSDGGFDRLGGTPTAELARPCEWRRTWRGALAALAPLVVAGAAVAAAVLVDQNANDPIIPPNVLPSVPVEQVLPTARPTIAPVIPTATANKPIRPAPRASKSTTPSTPAPPTTKPKASPTNPGTTKAKPDGKTKHKPTPAPPKNPAPSTQPPQAPSPTKPLPNIQAAAQLLP